MNEANTLPTLAFFGATEGCTIHCLAPALNAGYNCTALVRSLKKLQDMLRQQHGVSESTLQNHLTIVQGDVTDVTGVRQALYGPHEQPHPLRPTLIDPTICASATRTILEAARDLSKKPQLVVISTTCIDKKRDLPFAMMPLYHWMLKGPHKDKQEMETLTMKELEQPVNERAISDYLIIRPSLLTEGDGDGMHKIKEGMAENPVVGYVISRSDVGLWMFKRVVCEYRLKLSENSPLGAKVITITT
ncbi:hypothetical protein N7488_007409 [Penicillium malachiteum]|nr:hypothetical protein N7488_007409 [Penicillium malachiteum]